MPTPPLQIAVLGPQGSGKGTQSDSLARRLGLRHVSTGELLRRAASGTSAEAEVVRGFLDAGALVPPAIVDAVLAAEVRRSPAGCVFDGYPRTSTQADVLDRLVHLDVVVALDLSTEEVLRRISLRRVCDRCGETSATSHPSLVVHCGRCGAAMAPRTDDNPQAVRARLALYRRETAPLLDRYEARDLLVRVDASGTPAAVAARVAAAVAQRVALASPMAAASGGS